MTESVKGEEIYTLPEILLLGMYFTVHVSKCTPRGMYRNITGVVVCSSSKAEAAQMFTGSRVGRLWQWSLTFVAPGLVLL